MITREHFSPKVSCELLVCLFSETLTKASVYQSCRMITAGYKMFYQGLFLSPQLSPHTAKATSLCLDKKKE